MDSTENTNTHLSVIQTNWSDVRRAIADNSPDAAPAREQLEHRYGDAIRRYLRAALRNADAAEEIYQDFWIKLLKGAFRNADPSRGRFRALVKTALSNLVIDHFRRQKVRAMAGQDVVEAAADDLPESTEDADREFTNQWRLALFDRTWKALERAQRETRQPMYDVLRTRSENPALSSEEMAERVTALTSKPINAVTLRKVLSRAREKFARLLVDEVAHSLDRPTPDELEREVAELGLLRYCRSALPGLKGPGPAP
jgi:RNA polymerase sigma factor (sigma-70 family)